MDIIDKCLNSDGTTKVERLADLHPDEFGGTDYPDLPSKEEEAIRKFYNEHPVLKDNTAFGKAVVSFDEMDRHYAFKGSMKFNENDAWIQTYSGRRFNPTNPVVDAIVIQDIAHSLSMQCRFSGHTRSFYSVAQHCVLVSYICDSLDALWGLLHDASEAYLVDVPSPLKRSGQFESYIRYEKQMMEAICKRFGLPLGEPHSVKKADKTLLATEARDLMGPLRSDWAQPCEPLPFKIVPLMPQEAKRLYMKRFFDLTGSPHGFEHYLKYEGQGL